MKKAFTAVALAASLMAGAAYAQQDINPALIFDMGGKFDKSFNEAAYMGAEKFKADTGIDYVDFEITNEAQREQALRNFASRGHSPIVVLGFANEGTVRTVAPEFPETEFCTIDYVVDEPNVQSNVFKEHEGSFLVGMLAAMKSETGRVGFVGGMDIPLIRKFALGYEEGAKYVNPDVEVFQNMTGDTPAAWNDPTRGAELAQSQFDRGADVVYAAAGATGLGVLQAAADAGQYSIGVDSNQNYLYPGSVLTSMLKRVDLATYECFDAARQGNWEAGVRNLGLAEGGVDYAVDEHNQDLITDEMRARVEQAKQDIIDGKLQVTDYMAQ